jgi:YidC/Oxa1 family membrane protein insertase
MAGCLIIFLQIPIWYGLWSTLRYEPGLRQAPFLFVQDLTRPDMLLDLGFDLPFLGNYFNILPILYVILTVVNQRLQPRPQDPQMLTQYRMMTFMMIFFGFLFYSFAAGFLLYFLTSAFLGIIESKIIKAELARDERHEGGAAAVAAAPAGGAMYPGKAKKSEDEPRGRKRR